MSTEKTQSHIFEGKIQEYKEELMEFFLEVGQQRGQTPTLIKITGNLMIHGKLTQKQLKELTDLSIGTISTNFSALSSLNVIEKQIIPHSHTYEYSLKVDLSQNLASTFRIGLQYLNHAMNFIKGKKKDLESKFNHAKEEFTIFSNILDDLHTVLLLYCKLYEQFINPDLGIDFTEFIKKPSKLDHVEQISPEFREFEAEIVDFFMSTPIFIGKREIFSKTLGYFITRKVLTQNDLRELTGLSAGMVSQETHKLLDEGIIEIALKSKTGEIHYQRKSIIKTFFKISSNVLNVYIKWKKRLEEIGLELKNEEKVLKNLNGYENISKTLDIYLRLMPLFEKMSDHLNEILKRL